MSGFLRRTRSVVSRARGESSGSSQQPHSPSHAADNEEDVQDAPEDQAQQHPQDEGIVLIDSHGVVVRRRGRATCREIRDLPPGTRVNIEINNDGIPCNYPECNLLASYMGMTVKDPILAPISFADWRNPGMEPFKKLMQAEIEAKFVYPLHIRPWIRSSMGVKWRNYKTDLKAKYWDGRPIQEVIERVPEGVDSLQWATLVSRWNEPRDKERAAQNTENAKKEKCHHTQGRKSAVRRQQETSTQDRLQLWRLNRLHKDGSWTSDEAKQKWDLALELLRAQNLHPDDGNTEQNEKVFQDVMGVEHAGRVRCRGFGVTPSKFHPESSTSTRQSYSTDGTSNQQAINEKHFSKLEGDVGEIKGLLTKMFKAINKKSKSKKKTHTQTPSNDDEDSDDENDENGSGA